MLRIGLVLVTVAAAVAIGASLLLALRPSVTVASEVAPGVTVECRGIGDEEECLSYGDAVLAGGAPSNTFEMGDLTRLVIERPALGDASRCSAAWYIERYPDDPVWESEVACAMAGA